MSDSQPASAPPPRSGDPPIALRIEYTRINSFFADYARNISKGSTFVKTDRPVGVGTRFLFTFRLPPLPLAIPDTATRQTHAAEVGDDGQVLPLLGVVRWVTSAKQAGTTTPPGMGIEFLFADEDERDAIRAWVLSLMQQVLGPQLADRLLNADSIPP